jgi:hypothetical protein
MGPIHGFYGLQEQEGHVVMAIRMKGGKAEFAFVRSCGNGRVDALNLETGEKVLNVGISRFAADGGVSEIVNEVKSVIRAYASEAALSGTGGGGR